MVLGTLLNNRDIASLRDTFYAIDEDLDGGISAEELTKAYETVGMLEDEMDKEALIDVFDRLDYDKSGEVGFLQFVSSTLDPLLHLS